MLDSPIKPLITYRHIVSDNKEVKQRSSSSSILHCVGHNLRYSQGSGRSAQWESAGLWSEGKDLWTPPLLTGAPQEGAQGAEVCRCRPLKSLDGDL